MKKLLCFTILVLLLTSCWKDDGENINSDLIQTGENLDMQVVQLEEKDTLKDKTPDELTEIINKEIELLNTPSTKYPFFKQFQGGGNIDEIQKAGGMEVTRDQVYLIGLGDIYNFIDTLLSENEKFLSFHSKDNLDSFFYLDGNVNSFNNKLKTKFGKVTVLSNNKYMMDLEFSYKGKTYITYILKTIQESREQLDDVLGTSGKNKVSIFLKDFE